MPVGIPVSYTGIEDLLRYPRYSGEMKDVIPEVLRRVRRIYPTAGLEAIHGDTIFIRAMMRGEVRYFGVNREGKVTLSLDSMKPFAAAYGFELKASDLERLGEDLANIPGMREAIAQEQRAIGRQSGMEI